MDDEASLLLVNGKFLTRMGHEVFSYDQSKVALAAFEADAGGVDLIISDLNMPGVDGLTLVERMRQLRPNLPIILMTGFADEQFLTRVKNLPAAQVLQKPVLAAQLGEAVQKALSLAV
ncbi:MAG: response regulator [Verrucomicrobiota bacterium]